MTTVFKTLGARGRLPARAFRVLPLLFVAATLGACKHGDAGTQVDGWTLADPSQRHPIMVSQQPSHLNLTVARGSQGLTPSQRAEVLDFASHLLLNIAFVRLRLCDCSHSNRSHVSAK